MSGSDCPPLYADYANISLIFIWRAVPLLAVTMSFLCQLSLIHEHLRDWSRTGLLFPGMSNSSPKQLALPCTCLEREAVVSLSRSDVSTPSAVTWGLQAGMAIRLFAADVFPQLIAIWLAFVSRWKGYRNTCWERLATGNSSDGIVSSPLAPTRASDFWTGCIHALPALCEIQFIPVDKKSSSWSPGQESRWLCAFDFFKWNHLANSLWLVHVCVLAERDTVLPPCWGCACSHKGRICYFGSGSRPS